VDIPILSWTIENVRLSFALLGSMVVGVVIGILLK
jgi:F0F1-type ATP synthase assembly protein I